MPEPETAAAGLRRVSVGGRNLSAQIRGAGPTVVMEMGGGFGGVGPYWCVDGELARFCRVLVYDRAGLGGSDPIRGHPTIAERAQDLAGLLDALDIREPVLLAGWSLGGLIVQDFAARYPQRVGGLLLIDPTPPDFLADAGPLAGWGFSALMASMNRILLLLALAGAFRTRGGRTLARKMMAASFGSHMPPAYAELMVEALVQPPLHRAMILETDRLRQDTRDTLRLLTEQGLPRVPTILLAASHPPSADGKKRSEMYRRLLELAPEAEVRELPQTGHLIPAERPDSVIQAVRDLLARMGAKGGPGSTA